MSAVTLRPASEQQDRCSGQNHLWRQRTYRGFVHMACRCGAVHPNDLDEFLARSGRTTDDL